MSHCEAVTSFVSSFWMGEKEIKKKRYTHTHTKKRKHTAVQSSSRSWSPAGRKGTSKAERREALIIY